MKRFFRKFAVISLTIVLSISLLFGSLSPAYGALTYTGSALNWQYPIIYVGYQGFGIDTKLGQQRAIAQWNVATAVNCLAMSPVEHIYQNYPQNNGVSAVYSTNMYDPGIVAQNTIWSFGPVPRIIFESDINYNAGVPLSNGAVPGRYDCESVFLHEVGHTVGINDTYDAADSAKVMYGYAPYGYLKRTLTADDSATAYYRYHR